MKPSIKSYLVRRIILVVGIFCVAAGLLWSQGGISERDLARVAADPALSLSFPVRPLTIETTDGKTIDLRVEVAATPEHWAQGLMYRKELAPDYGMLFDFRREEPVWFWMKNTFVSLDMIFARADGTIVNVAPDTTPLSEATVASAGPVRFVFEVVAGTAARIGLKPGDRLVHPRMRPAK